MVSFLQKREVKERAGLVAVVGSSTVTVSIVVSKPKLASPIVVWSQQENIKAGELTPMLSALFTIASDQGQRALWQKFPKLKITTADISLAAPFAHTVIKQVKTTFKQPTKISDDMIEDITEKAEKEVKQMLTETIITEPLNLAVVSSLNVGLTLNGYRLKESGSNTASVVELHQLFGFCDTKLLQSLKDAVLKVFPSVSIDISTLMADFYSAIRQTVQHLDDAALISITNKATELCIIPEDIPIAVGFSEVGKDDLVEKLIDKVGLSEGNALGLMSDAETTYKDKLSATRQEMVGSVLAEYENSLVKLFKKLNSSFTVPKVVYLHTPPHNQDIFTEIIMNTAKSLNAGKVRVYPVTTGLLGGAVGEDVTTLLPAIVFHTQK